MGVKYEDPRRVVKEMWEYNIVFLGGPAVKERISLEELIKLPFLSEKRPLELGGL